MSPVRPQRNGDGLFSFASGAVLLLSPVFWAEAKCHRSSNAFWETSLAMGIESLNFHFCAVIDRFRVRTAPAEKMCSRNVNELKSAVKM